MKRLKLPVKLVRALNEKHGINLLNVAPEDAGKMANIDFLTEVYYEGSRSWGDEAPSKESIEEMDLHDLIGAVKASLGGDSPGKD